MATKKEEKVELTEENIAWLEAEDAVKQAESKKRSKALNEAYDRAVKSKNACKRSGQPWTQEETTRLKMMYPLEGSPPNMLAIPFLEWVYKVQRLPSECYDKWVEMAKPQPKPKKVEKPEKVETPKEVVEEAMKKASPQEMFDEPEKEEPEEPEESEDEVA